MPSRTTRSLSSAALPVLLMAALLPAAMPAVAAPALRIVAPMAAYIDGKPEWRVLVVVQDREGLARNVYIEAHADRAEIISLVPAPARIEAERDAVFFLTLRGEGHAARLVASCEGQTADIDLPVGLDLLGEPWEAWHTGEATLVGDITAVPAQAPWEPRRLPAVWEDQGLTWLRRSVVIPQVWRGREMDLSIRAVDDADATFFNGTVIGRMDGWDRQRTYPIAADLVRWGEENEIHIAVHNGHAGGGVAWPPVFIAPAGETPTPGTMFPDPVLQREAERRPPGPIGPAHPVRPMVVRDGVLTYEDGGEVALWGVNCYPQSWSQYQTLQSLGVDHYRAVDEDISELAELGIEIVRVHVFDTEISDRDGDLIHNDHLDILDYLIAQCTEHGIYLMLTPMAWWPSANQRPDSFSLNTPKESMSMWEEGWPIQAHYLTQFLQHVNPYTGRRIVDEPTVALFEVINEPTYWNHSDVASADAGAHPTLLAIRRSWEGFCPDESWQTPGVFAYFRYDLVRRYVNAMVDAMRGAGAHQPIAYSSWTWQGTDLGAAVGESRCDAVTMSAYPGGLSGITDDRNMLPSMGNGGLDSRLADKARIVYEFDADGTVERVCLYPAMARHWRNLGVQVACQFQYDSRAAAHINVDWPQHYLNAYHTPEKMVSFLIGQAVFHALWRGTILRTPEDNQLVGDAAVSFEHNAALLCAEEAYMQARPTPWQPLAPPAAPRRVLAVGSTPYYEYEGTGLVDLRIDGDTARLAVYPDVDRLRPGWAGTPEEPLTRLVEREHLFALRLPGWEAGAVSRRVGDAWEPAGVAGGFGAIPGEYRVQR